MKTCYLVIVGSVGTVYHGKSKLQAERKFDKYAKQSKSEVVLMLRDNEVLLAHRLYETQN